MGMYDTLNGEQVKCFPWISYIDNEDMFNFKLWNHGGSLKSYGNGDKIPYKSYSYNYTKNFIIIDSAPYDEDTDFVVHVIKDGKLFDTISSDKIDEATMNSCFLDNNVAIDYNGTFLNINSLQDIYEYVAAIHKKAKDIKEATKESSKLFKEYSSLIHEYGILEPDSDEKKDRKIKLKDVHDKLQDAKTKEYPYTNKINKEFNDRWITVDKYEDESIFGSWLESSIFIDEHPDTVKDIEGFKKDVKTVMDKLPVDIIDRYIKWQEEPILTKEKIIKSFKI